MSYPNRNSSNNGFPDIPVWALVLSFMIAPPLGVILVVLKIMTQSKPDPTRWNSPDQSRYNSSVDNNFSFQHRTSTRTSSGTTIRTSSRSSEYSFVKDPQQNEHKQTARPQGNTFHPEKLKSGKALVIVGFILAGIFGLTAGSIFADWGIHYLAYALEDAFVPLALACGGLGMGIWGSWKDRRYKKFKRYLARLNKKNPMVPLRPLAESMGSSMDEVCQTLQDMIDLGVFGDRAYIDIASEMLVLDANKAQPTPPKKEEPAKKASAPDPDEQILKDIRDANDRIPGPVISAKIARIEEITRHILNYAKKHPERAGELRTFLDYYLPTTLKMLNTYAELDAQKLDGENIAATKQRIENVLDKVVEGFERQLDKLFEGDMLDISSDIDVMEKMLQRDGLAGDMRMPRVSPSAPQQSSQGYTPSLTLDPTPQQASFGSAAASAPDPGADTEYDRLGSL